MATGDANPVFVDTNVLVYANVARAPLHAEALTAIRTYHQAGATICTSRQVLREYLAVLSRPQSFTSPRPVATLIERVQYFESRFLVLEDGSQVTMHLLTLLEQLSIGGKQVHDANIVATMRAYGIGRLLTANVGDFARFAHLITLLPLEAVA
jgi:predicted nucleic acid-binding protein